MSLVPTWTFQQLRARIAHTAVQNYTRDELFGLLEQLDTLNPADFFASDLSIGYRIAWRLLPAICDDRSVLCASK